MIQLSLKKQIDIPLILFEFGILWLCFTSFHLSFSLSKVIPLLISGSASVLLILPLSITRPDEFKFNKNNLIFVIVYLLICIYQISFAGQTTIYSIALFSTKFILGSIIIISSHSLKLKLLNTITFTLGVVLAISLFGWLLFLSNVPLPHYTTYDGKFYVHTNYYLFLLNGYPGRQLIPRFTSMFLEPGHLASTCALLLFINRYNLKRWENALMLIALLLSFSLAGYGLLIAGYGMHLITNSKRRVLHLTIFFLFVIAIVGITISASNTKNPVYTFIISRLEYDNSTGEIAGDNRYSSRFETHYSLFIESKDKFFGLGKLPEEDRWWINSAGWKRLLVTQGILGTVLIFLFYFIYFLNNRSLPGFELLALFIVSNMIRDHVLREYWLFMYIIAIQVLNPNALLYKKKLIESKT
jgi:hypothetical protein